MNDMQTTLCYIEREGRTLMLHRVKKKNDMNHDKWLDARIKQLSPVSLLTLTTGVLPRGNALFILRIFERHIQGDDETNVVFFARIHALFTDFTTLDSALRNAQRLGRRLNQ